MRPEQAQFYRPELHSFWERFTGRRLVQILGWTALIAGTAALVAFAIVKFAA
ncbi:hypothetical protein [Herbiconiux sp.]|uniref:hypothetical protein n=1 Tax=Herbiconiux sp. TaxID=1871186 RepID=UPI0025C059C1|nr:hypothetical protein [Herbiconiux sp.]